MFSESEEDLSDDGGGKHSPDSTSNIPYKRQRLGSDSSNPSRSITPAYSSRESSLERKVFSDEDEDDNGQATSKKKQTFYRSRSTSHSRSKSRSRSRSISRSRSRSRSQSISRSRSRPSSHSRSPSRSRSISRSVSPMMTQKKKRVVNSTENLETDYDDEDNVENVPTKILGLDLSESEDEDDPIERQVESGGTKRIANKSNKVTADSSEDEGPRRDRDDEEGGGNDFERMMHKKKAENRRLRRKKDIDVINDNDDAIAKMIADMRIAAKEDRDLNDQGKPATKKMGMFKRVMHNITKVELQMAFIEANLLSVMTDWLAPMPDKSLPHVMIRSEFMRMLLQFKVDDPTRLKESGIGKAVMYLYRHPKETKNNKELAGHIINDWARPIFHKEADFAHMTKEDRREKDAAMAKRVVMRKKKSDDSEEQILKPGDPGWVGRARVPMVDNAEYVRRPNWQNSVDLTKSKAKKEVTLLEKHKRKFAERKRISKNNTMVKISIEGSKMGLGYKGFSSI